MYLSFTAGAWIAVLKILVPLHRTEREMSLRSCILFLQVRDCCDKYTNIFVYDVANMRNNRIKELRALWEDSRFFYGKNRVMQLALGRSDAEEYRDGLCSVAEVCPVECTLVHIDNTPCFSHPWPVERLAIYLSLCLLKMW